MILYFCKHCGSVLHAGVNYCSNCGEIVERDGESASISLPVGTTSLNINFVPQASAAQNKINCAITADGKLPSLYADILKVVAECGLITVQMLRYRFPVGYIDCCKIMEWLEKNKYVERVGSTNIYKSLVSRDGINNSGQIFK